MTRNGKTMEQPSETPEEIVALLGNIANRPDIRAIQERQVQEIKLLIEEAYMNGYREGREYRE